MRRRVVVTGLGLVTALGGDLAAVWARLRDGRTGIRTVDDFDTAGCRCTVGALLDRKQIEAALAEMGRRPMDPAVDLALLSAERALRQAGASADDGAVELPEVATLFATGMGPAETLTEAFDRYATRDLQGLRPTTVPRAMMNAISATLSMQFGLGGANYVIVAACTSATNAIGEAFRRIRHGYSEAILCGGSEAFFNRPFFGVWNKLGVLSRNPDPESACRPFDAGRDGCVLGEGAGALLLESEEGARRRGAAVLGEILGYGDSSDALHLTRPDPAGQARALEAALVDAGVRPAEVGLINAHGTATRSNDSCEAASIRAVFAAEADRVPVVASKSFFGHTLGASGAVETIATLLCLQAGEAHPNLNLDTPDPECNLHLVGPDPLPLRSLIAVKNSFGFGGGNGVLVVGAPE